MLADSCWDVGHFWDLVARRSGHVSKPDGDPDQTAERMMLNFAESGHPIFRATSALERGDLKIKEKSEIHSLQR